MARLISKFTYHAGSESLRIIGGRERLPSAPALALAETVQDIDADLPPCVGPRHHSRRPRAVLGRDQPAAVASVAPRMAEPPAGKERDAEAPSRELLAQIFVVQGRRQELLTLDRLREPHQVCRRGPQSAHKERMPAGAARQRRAVSAERWREIRGFFASRVAHSCRTKDPFGQKLREGTAGEILDQDFQ